MEITSAAALDEAIAMGKVIIEVYANWCPDCKRIEAKLPEWAKEYEQQFTLLRCNRDEVPDVAERYEVMGIPSFLVFEDGELKNRLFSRDAKSAKQVEDFLSQQYK